MIQYSDDYPQKEITDLAVQQAEEQASILKSQLEINKLSATVKAGPIGLSAQEEANFAAQGRALDIQAAQITHSIRYSIISLEYELLDAQRRLLEEQWSLTVIVLP